MLCTSQNGQKTAVGLEILPRVIGLVLARGGSKGIFRKNVHVICGQPLITWVLKPMKDCKGLDEIWVSTDDDEIANVANAMNHPPSPDAVAEGATVNVFRRSPLSATDGATSVAAVEEFLKHKPDCDVVVLVQCTSPCLHPSYLDEAIRMVTSGDFDSVFSVARDHKYRWTELGTDGTTRPLNFDPASRVCRQEWAGEIVESGHFYVTRVSLIKQGLLQGGRCGFVELPAYLCQEVDSEDDLVMAEYKLQKYGYGVGGNENNHAPVIEAPTEFQ